VTKPTKPPFDPIDPEPPAEPHYLTMLFDDPASTKPIVAGLPYFLSDSTFPAGQRQ
jgi:hypothetical protein